MARRKHARHRVVHADISAPIRNIIEIIFAALDFREARAKMAKNAVELEPEASLAAQ